MGTLYGRLVNLNWGFGERVVGHAARQTTRSPPTVGERTWLSAPKANARSTCRAGNISGT
ncbi:protein of unknown function [Candidatus Promineifilum breve]|uniref:Uncharacterized protein n=1 Tax=Candidatus Promineifilum breve TaxID=1806508 RepID=A0A160SY67_9CHLR|nr:protein of unknown function [Candidatus Promineifilum breve]